MISCAGDNDTLLQAVAELGWLRSPRRVTVSGATALEGEIRVEEHDVTLQLLLDASFPLSLPVFLLRPWDALGFIPHVLPPAGIVCFAAAEGLVLDRRRPLAVIEWALERTARVLADGVAGRNHADFLDELEVYWRLLVSERARGRSFSIVEPGNDVRRVIVVANDGPEGRILYTTNSAEEFVGFTNGRGIGGRLVIQYGVCLPLEPGTQIVPPRPDGPFWTVDETRRVVLAGLSHTNRTRLQQLVKRPAHRQEYVLLEVARPAGGVTFVGLRFDDAGGVHPLFDGGTASGVVPLDLARLDRSYLVQRAGGDADLASKRVLVVGCGAVGGYLALELARAGICDLTLVDNDELRPENTFRHVLGRRYWGTAKVRALKAEMETLLPYVRITPVVATIQEAIARRVVTLAGFDHIVLSLGNPTVELEINEQLQPLRDGPTAVFTWLEPFGIGGHALLSRNATGGGCFACLYTPPAAGDGILANRAALAAPGQEFGRDLSGCGSLHTPYGALDAMRTAELAARLSLDALTGREVGNPLRSWKGDATAFTAAGYRLSLRYGMSEAELHDHRYAYRNPGCFVCQAPRSDEILSEHAHA